MVGGRVLLLDQILGRSIPVVEDVLLLLKHPSFVPRLTILIAAPQVWHRKPSTLLHPPGIFWIPIRHHAQGKSTIPCHQQPLAAVPFHAFLPCDKHRHPRAVLRWK